MKLRLASSALVACLGMAPVLQTAHAATQTASLNVSLTVQSTCSVFTGGTLAFGSTADLSSAIDSQASLSVTCSNNTPYNIGLDAGNASGSTVADRVLTSATPTNTTAVHYQLYRDASRLQTWGNTVGTDTYTGTGDGTAQSVAVYGRVLGGQSTPPADSYASVVTATITY